ncbi:hypothetical protein ES708_21394 [subsurface metagenome]
MTSQFIIALIFFFTSLVYSTFGFGFAMISIPLLSLVLSPKTAIPLSLLMGLGIGFYLIITSCRDIKPKQILYLLIGSAIGVPFGVFILKNISSEILEIAINAVIITSAIILFLEQSKNIISVNTVNTKLITILIGFLSGFLGASTGICGPPVILYGLNQKWEKKIFRSNLLTYFFIWRIYTNINYFFIGLVNFATFFKYIIPSSIGLIFGAISGKALCKIISQEKYHKICWILIIALAFFGIIKATIKTI